MKKHSRARAQRAFSILLAIGGAAGTVPLIVVPAAAQTEQTPEQLVDYADKCFNAKLLGEAAASYKRFLDANPKHPKAGLAAYRMAAAIYRIKKDANGPDYAAAAKAYEGALGKYSTLGVPDEVISDARFELGEAYYFLEKPEKTVAALTDFLKKPLGTGQKVAWASYYIGKSYYALNKNAEAKAAFERVRDNFPATEPAPYAALEIGLLALDGTQYDAASAGFKLLLEKFPKSEVASEARVRLGDAYLGAKNWGEAKNAYAAALGDAQIGDLKPDALLGAADAEFGLKNYPAAADGYSKLLAALPAKDARRNTAQLRLGNSHYNAKNYDAALNAYAPLLEGADSALCVPAIYFSAASKLAQSKFGEAATFYRKITDNAAKPEFAKHTLAPRAALRLGDALSGNKEPLKAAEAYKAVLTRFGQTNEAKEAQKSLIEVAAEVAKSKDSAPRAAMDTLLRDLPAAVSAPARLPLAWALLDAGKFSEAATLAQSVADAKGDPKTTEQALYYVASAKLNAKDETAAEAFRKQLAAFPAGDLAGSAQLGLAWTMLDAKKWPEAEAAAKAAVALNKDDDKDRAQLALGEALLGAGKAEAAGAAFANASAAKNPELAHDAAKGRALAMEKAAAQKPELWAQAAAAWGQLADKAAEKPAQADARLRQGLALVEAKDGAGAQKAFDAVLTIDAKSDNAARSLYESAWLARDAKQNEAEAKFWARLETEFPQSKYTGEAIFQQGKTAFEAQKWSDAGAAYRRLLEKFPTHDRAPLSRYQLAASLYREQKWADAAPEFDKAAAASSGVKSKVPLDANYWAAESYRRAGKKAEAAARYETFVKAMDAGAAGAAAVPVDLLERVPSARLGWGQSVSDPIKAAEIFRPALAAAKGAQKTELSFRLGEALAKQGKHADALPLLLDVVVNAAASPWGAQSQWLVGEALEKTGKKADALEMYKTLSERADAAEWATKAKEKLNTLAN